MSETNQGINRALITILEQTNQELHKIALKEMKNPGLKYHEALNKLIDEMVDIRGKIIKLKLEEP